MKLLTSFKSFFAPKKADPLAQAAFEAFANAFGAYSDAYDAVDTFSTRANHRFAIWSASRAIANASTAGEAERAKCAYDETVAACKDPADHEPYTELELDAHTRAIENLTAAFDTAISACANLKPADDDSLPAKSREALCKGYAFATASYWRAVSQCNLDAIQGQLQAVRDKWEAMRLQARAERPDQSKPALARAQADAFASEVEARTARLDSFKKKAEAAEIRAKQLEAKAQAALNAELSSEV